MTEGGLAQGESTEGKLTKGEPSKAKWTHTNSHNEIEQSYIFYLWWNCHMAQGFYENLSDWEIIT